ncbi:MAG: hypothetical protein FJZ00_14510, partial [Candidatus Sericytochromatia bacterium]|nr:hypothetical protein [Candidatus Tanganyikabacteria bacterium]
MQEPETRYQQQPLDTSWVALPPELADLSDILSRNTHEIWARGRIAEGWRYGPQRDDFRREHPGLVPYDELSDSEKAYDRWTALGAIEAILALGYRIVPPEAVPDAAPIAAAVTEAERLLAAQGRDPHELDAALRIPPVVLFAGHMVDQPDRVKPRFPADRAAAVK